MADLTSLSDAQAILLACELCAAGNVNALPRLHQQFPTSLTTERLFRIILSFLPETTPPAQYTPVLDELNRSEPAIANNENIDLSSIKDVEEPVARKRVRRLRLLPLQYSPDENTTESASPLTEFLIHRAHRIDAETGLQTLILELLMPFYDRSETLRQFLVSLVLPLLRSNYEYYPENEEKLSLHVFDSLDAATGINILLSMTGTDPAATDLAQNLRGLVGPWISGGVSSKRRKLSHADETASTAVETVDQAWQTVNEWLLSRSLVDFENVASGILAWDGPEDVDLGGYLQREQSLEESDRLRIYYGQTGLAIIYTTDPDRGSLDTSFQIISKVASLLQLDTGAQIKFDDDSLPRFTIDISEISTASKALLLQNALLKPNNLLTTPTAQAVGFLQTILVSLRLLRSFGYHSSCRSAATVCLQNSEEAQALEIHGVIDMIVKQTKPGQDWRRIRGQILWLRDWRGVPQDAVDQTQEQYHGLFWRVSRTSVETELLRAMITAGDYQAAAEIYTGVDSPLDSTQVEAAVVETIITFYDTASNGNKTRGKVKRAVDAIRAFQPHFPNSNSLKEISALISATHAISFYSLTLQHGIPFQPVSIRVHNDPLSLIEKVLDQNPKSYTQLDDLLSIGRGFIAAGLPLPLPGDDLRWKTAKVTPEQKSTIAEKRIVSMAVSSALSSDDFGTAYSYILTRLTPPSLMPTTTPSSLTSIHDDISWRAAYNAGRHRSSTTTPLTTQISTLSQRLELLSLSLILAPSPDPLPEILGAWRRCDEELSTLRDREAQEAEAWDRKGDITTSLSSPSTIPGGFGPSDRELDAYENEKQAAARVRNTKNSSSGYDDSAPMGLFDVARGAARAFSKNIPLHHHQHANTNVSRTSITHESSSSRTSEEMSRSIGEVGGGERVRKRDVVSNMVTGGLASGIGWVLGAQPVSESEGKERE
ncbi:Sec39 domain-containing protein [Talaromyces proteolyticus]|uniref:Sec39 domain-containing protein n=1 Tax=Talaromyces proteolyticus TaxID=1131652 RepID=A0AAD4KHV8_9EURO|nr:Sec39 domain-containing protein [Talaromyces proteolyticus]KAH8692812.1 Sec39 domain-containing protein [Talaromyces proteolyticus]